MPGTFQTVNESPGGGVLGIGGFAASNLLLLTDGTVICQSERFREWRRLSPGPNGDYRVGSWSDIAAMADAREFFASAVLADGRVVVAGGEIRSGILGIPDSTPVDAAEIYDPVANTWSPFDAPSDIRPLSDAPACLLADGRWLVGCATNNNTALLNPETMTWSATIVKPTRPDEETWTLLPDGSVLAVNTFLPQRVDRFLADQNVWVQEANPTPLDLADEIGHEIGPAVLMPDGRVFCIGGSGHTAIYTPSGTAATGSWVAGPDIIGPGGALFHALDAPACLLPNGHVLFVAGTVANDQHTAAGDPTYFEFDGASITSLGIPFNAALNFAFRHRMILLPTGQVLITWANTSVWLFTPGDVTSSWQPEIVAIPPVVHPGGRFRLYGTQLCGVSQAASYGDDYQAAENYPLLRNRRFGQAGFGFFPTGNHTSMRVARDGSLIRTSVSVQAEVDDGFYQVSVAVTGGVSPEIVLQVGGQAGWRWCNKCQGLTFTGNPSPGTCAAGGLHDHAGSGAYLVVAPRRTNASVPSTMKWCARCEALTLGSTPGACPSGGNHDHTGSASYSLLRAQDAGGRGQAGWAVCARCAEVVFTDNAAPGSCGAGGNHAPGPERFSIFGDSPVDQENWRWCSRCQGLWFAGGGPPGVCPAGGGPHNASGSGNYTLYTGAVTGSNGQSGWGWCHKCQGLWTTLRSSAANVCPAGGVHEATGSGNYTLFIHQPGQDIGQHDWHDCVKCRGLYFAGNGSNGLCPAGRDHKTTGTGSYLLSGVG